LVEIMEIKENPDGKLSFKVRFRGERNEQVMWQDVQETMFQDIDMIKEFIVENVGDPVVEKLAKEIRGNLEGE
jgi:hypothetical protein